MSVDLLQEKIRKRKNPTILELNMPVSDLPNQFQQENNISASYGTYCRQLLEGMKDLIPAVRISFAAFAIQGPEGIEQLKQTLCFASECGYYIVLDAPEILSTGLARSVAEALLGEKSDYVCDGLIISGYLGSDVIKPFLPYCQKRKKDIYVVARTANKSASELQDLLAGSRLVHAVAADHVNRYGSDTTGKFGYTGVGILAAASAPDSLRNMRTKYPKLFFLVDGYDYPNSNAKNCAYAFDKYGHGAAVCAGASITCAWKENESDGTDFLIQARSAAERMKKNMNRYVTVL